MVTQLHIGLATTATLFMFALAIWGLFRFLRGHGVDGSYLGALAVGEILIVVQGLVGVFLYAGGARTANDSMHILYGISTLLSIPAFYAYTRGETGRREQLMWALICLWVWGLTLRADTVAGLFS